MRKAIGIVGVSVLILGFGMALRKAAQGPGARLALSCLAVSTSSNVLLISLGITNQSDSTMVYAVCPTEAKSNGVWTALNAVPFPPAIVLAQLAAGASTSAIVTAPWVGGESRVPVLWGFDFLPTATPWQEAVEDVTAWFRMHDFRGRGALYTNYVTGIGR